MKNDIRSLERSVASINDAILFGASNEKRLACEIEELERRRWTHPKEKEAITRALKKKRVELYYLQLANELKFENIEGKVDKTKYQLSKKRLAKELYANIEVEKKRYKLSTLFNSLEYDDNVELFTKLIELDGVEARKCYFEALAEVKKLYGAELKRELEAKKAKVKKAREKTKNVLFGTALIHGLLAWTESGSKR